MSEAGGSNAIAGNFPVVTVIGAGQLARMMQPPAVALGIRLRVVAERDDDAAALAVADVRSGAADDAAAILAAARGTAVVTFDHEHVPADVLAAVTQEGVPVEPPPAALVHAQDKLVMRRRLAEFGAAMPAWTTARDVERVRAFGHEHGWPVVVKTPRGGYDGKGVALVDEDELDGLSDWFARFPEGLLAEERVDFVRELAVLVARSPSGQAAAWPVVETRQVDGVCETVVAPAPGLDEDLAAAATALAIRIAGELGVTGVMAVEGFETADGRFLVNELAMRPHNSGHWTIEGSVTSQFEQHLRAVLDLPLGDPSPRDRWCVMVNVLGGRYEDLYRSYLHVMAHDPGVKVHLYGKGVRPGRKIGHVTGYGDDLDAVMARVRHAALFIQGDIDG